MRRWEAAAAIVGVLLLGGALLWPEPQHTTTVATVGVLQTATCRVPFTRYEHVSGPHAGTAIIFHGLSANRKLMTPAARWMMAARLRQVYTVDMPGHGDSTEPFTFERAEQCAAEFVSVIAPRKEEAGIAPRGDAGSEPVVLIGHSAGGGIAIRLADRYSATATIAMSPAPLTPRPGPWESGTPFRLPRRLPGNLLVFIAQLDPFPIRDSAKQWVAEAGGNNDAERAFDRGQALRLTDVSRAVHTSVLVDSQVARQSVHWVRRALRMPATDPPPAPPLAYIPAMLGLMLIFPAAARVTARAFGAQAAEPAAESKSLIGQAYLVWLVASVLAALLLKLWIPLRVLRLFTGDYLASFLLIVGAAGTAWLWSKRPAQPPSDASSSPLRAAAMAALFGLLVVLAVSATLNWQITDMWMNAPRWLRFPFVALAVLPYTLAEEWALGAPRSGWSAVGQRMLQAMGLRALLWTAMLLAFLLLRSNQVLIPLLTLYLALFSAAQRLATDAVRQRTGSAAAAAVFDAILAAWFIAGLFPLN